MVDVAILKGELLSKLSTMGIAVYDVLRYDKDGKPILPDKNCFRDERRLETDPFTKVCQSVVVSRRGVLAIGEIK